MTNGREMCKKKYALILCQNCPSYTAGQQRNVYLTRCYSEVELFVSSYYDVCALGYINL